MSEAPSTTSMWRSGEPGARCRSGPAAGSRYFDHLAEPRCARRLARRQTGSDPGRLWARSLRSAGPSGLVDGASPTAPSSTPTGGSTSEAGPPHSLRSLVSHAELAAQHRLLEPSRRRRAWHPGRRLRAGQRRCAVGATSTPTPTRRPSSTARWRGGPTIRWRRSSPASTWRTRRRSWTSAVGACCDARRRAPGLATADRRGRRPPRRGDRGGHRLRRGGGSATGPIGVGCDFFESVPSGADVYFVSNVLHDWDDDLGSCGVAEYLRAAESRRAERTIASRGPSLVDRRPGCRTCPRRSGLRTTATRRRHYDLQLDGDRLHRLGLRRAPRCASWWTRLLDDGELAPGDADQDRVSRPGARLRSRAASSAGGCRGSRPRPAAAVRPSDGPRADQARRGALPAGSPRDREVPVTDPDRLVHIVDDVPELEGRTELAMVLVLDGFLDAGNAAALAARHLVDAVGRRPRGRHLRGRRVPRLPRPPAARCRFIRDHYERVRRAAAGGAPAAPTPAVAVPPAHRTRARQPLGGLRRRGPRGRRALRRAAAWSAMGAVPMAVPAHPADRGDPARQQRRAAGRATARGAASSGSRPAPSRCSSCGWGSGATTRWASSRTSPTTSPSSTTRRRRCRCSSTSSVTAWWVDLTDLREARARPGTRRSRRYIADNDEVARRRAGLEQQYDAFARRAAGQQPARRRRADAER